MLHKKRNKNQQAAKTFNLDGFIQTLEKCVEKINCFKLHRILHNVEKTKERLGKIIDETEELVEKWILPTEITDPYKSLGYGLLSYKKGRKVAVLIHSDAYVLNYVNALEKFASDIRQIAENCLITKMCQIEDGIKTAQMELNKHADKLEMILGADLVVIFILFCTSSDVGPVVVSEHNIHKFPSDAKIAEETEDFAQLMRQLRPVTYGTRITY